MKKNRQRLSPPAKSRPSSRDAGSTDDEAITPAKLLGYLTAAYVLNAAGLLDPRKRERLDSLTFPGVEQWDVVVERSYEINMAFVRQVFTQCRKLKSEMDSVLFILRGLGCPDCNTRLKEVLGRR